VIWKKNDLLVESPVSTKGRGMVIQVFYGKVDAVKDVKQREFEAGNWAMEGVIARKVLT
jgi:hypothetical protein